MEAVGNKQSFRDDVSPKGNNRIRIVASNIKCLAMYLFCAMIGLQFFL